MTMKHMVVIATIIPNMAASKIMGTKLCTLMGRNNGLKPYGIVKDNVLQLHFTNLKTVTTIACIIPFFNFDFS